MRLKRFLAIFLLGLLAACGSGQTIVSNVSERDANEIVVYLASKGIESQKVLATSTQPGGANTSEVFNIMVSPEREVEAMAVLSRVGLPRKQGTNLLELFGQQGLVSSTFQDNIRYQAGLLEELKNTIRKIDGVIDADIQVSFPTGEAAPGVTPPKINAAVYIKHQGVLEDPNSHLEVKIKRLLSGSIQGLDYDSVAVISDRSRMADITLTPDGEPIGPKMLQTYVSIWGVVMTKSSLTRFRLLFIAMIFMMILMCGAIAWLVYKFYPIMRTAKAKTAETPPPETP